MAARDTLLVLGPSLDRESLQRTVKRARKWEHAADELVKRSREVRGRGDESGPILNLLGTADDSADGLEEAIYWMSLLAEGVPADAGTSLQSLAGLVAQAAQEYLKAVENARCLHRGISREQVADFLEAVDRIITLERLADLQLDSIWTVRLAAADGCRPIGKGVNASPGVAVGEAVFQPAAAVALSSSGRIGWLARKFTPPE